MQKKRMRNRKGRNAAQNLGIIKLHNLEVVPPPGKMAGSDRHTTPIRIIPRIPKKWSDSSSLPLRSETSGVEHPAAAYVL